LRKTIALALVLIMLSIGFHSCHKENTLESVSQTMVSSESNNVATSTTKSFLTALPAESLSDEEIWRKLETDRLLWNKNKDAAIKEVEDELTAKGWSSIKSTFYEAKYMSMCDIVGQVDDGYRNPMTVRVDIIFTEFYPEGKLDYVTYTSDTGRWYGCIEILPANDQRLYEHFH